MLLKLMFIVLALSLFLSISEATQTTVRNETILQPRLLKESDIQPLRESLQLLKSDIQLLQWDSQNLKSQLERHESLINGLLNKSNLRSCNEAKFSGIHHILISSFGSQPFSVSCDVVTRGGGWTVILRRMDGSVDFNRNWTEYKEGFGDLNGEFILGLDKIHALTAERDHELLVLLEDKDGIEAFETYDEFAIGNEEEQYVLRLGQENGTARDSLGPHRDMKFTTLDRDNDSNPDGNCAAMRTGGWWYRNCHQSHLTGTYNDNNYAMGVTWAYFRGHENSLKRATMMIRPKQ